MYIYGKNPVKDLMNFKPEYIKKVFLDKKRHQSFFNELIKNKIDVYDFKTFNKKSIFKNNENLQGIIALIKEPKILSLKELIEKHKNNNNSVFLILDGITDPQNFGAILRNAAAFGVTGVLFPSRNSSPLSAVAIKASSGNWMKVDLCETASLNQVVDSLKKNGYWIASSSLDGKDDLDTLSEWNQPLAIILGGEGSGVKKSLKDKSEIVFKINMDEKVESLNVSAASAIILHYIYK